MTSNEIMAIAKFLGEDMTEEQATRIMDEAREMIIEYLEDLLNEIHGCPIHTKLITQFGELGQLIMSMHDS